LGGGGVDQSSGRWSWDGGAESAARSSSRQIHNVGVVIASGHQMMEHHHQTGPLKKYRWPKLTPQKICGRKNPLEWLEGVSSVFLCGLLAVLLWSIANGGLATHWKR